MKRNTTLFIALGVLVFIASLAFAAPWEKLLYDDKMIEKVGLSKDQLNQLRELHLDIQKETIKLQSELRVKELELRHELRAEKPDVDEVMRLIEEGGKARTELRKLQTQRLLKSRELLEPEQREKVKKLVRQWAKQRQRKGESRRIRAGERMMRRMPERMKEMQEQMQHMQHEWGMQPPSPPGPPAPPPDEPRAWEFHHQELGATAEFPSPYELDVPPIPELPEPEIAEEI